MGSATNRRPMRRRRLFTWPLPFPNAVRSGRGSSKEVGPGQYLKPGPYPRAACWDGADYFVVETPISEMPVVPMPLKSLETLVPSPLAVSRQEPVVV